MGDSPWQGDACSLVSEFRSGRRSPSEELEATHAAIDAGNLNAFCYLPREQAERAAADADINKPFGGVPIGVKELDQVAGWPDTHASVPFRDEVADVTSVMVQRIRDVGGAVLAGQTTASEFGGVNVTRTVLHGTTHNPWEHGRTPGGSSGGTAAAVSGGLVTIATGGDGGGSIRIPAGFTGLVGLKATIGRIPLGPRAEYGNLTVTIGCLSRSVRDTARWFDVCNGYEARDPLSLPRVEGWENGLGTHLDALRGARVAVVPTWGSATVSPIMWELLDEAAIALIADTGMTRVDDVDTTLPNMGAVWSISGMLGTAAKLGDRWPDCADELTPEIRSAMRRTEGLYNAEARAKIERRRVDLNEAMARVFDPADGVDFVITASNPDVAFDADGPLPSAFGGIDAGAKNNGRLTFPANLHGNPAISIPAGTLDGLPIGLQVVGRHFSEELLLDLALSVERPAVAIGRARLSTMTSVEPAGTRLDRQQRLLAIGLVLGVTMVAFEITAVITALPTITDELHGDSLYGVALACYTLANLVALVVTGELTDRYGPAKPYLASLGVFALGLVIAATAPTMAVVVVGRTLQGAGTGGLAPIAYVLVKRAFPPDRQPSMYAYLSAGWVLPSLIAPAIAGSITDQVGWRWVFWLLLPLIPVVAFITVRPMRAYAATGEGEVRLARIRAAVFAAAGIGIFVTALQFEDTLAIVVGAVVGATLAVPSLRRLLPAGFHRAARGLPAVVLCRILATAAFLGADSFIPLAADRIHGVSPTVQGFVIIGASLSWTTGQWLISRHPGIDPRRAVRWGFTIMALGLALSVPVLRAGWPLWATFFSWAIGGFGMGLLFNPTTVTAMSHADEGAEGLVSSQVNLADAIGFSLMGGIGGALVAVADRTSLSLPAALGLNFTLAITLALTGTICARRIAAR